MPTSPPTAPKKSVLTKLNEFVKHYRLPIVSGFLIGTSYIPFPPWALFFCQVPLLLFWLRATEKPDATLKQAFLAGWITQFILNLIGFHWIAYTAAEFGHFPIYGGIATLIGFAAIAHLYYPLAGLLAFWLLKKIQLPRTYRLFVFVLIFALCDRLVPKIFPWHFGYPWLWAKFPGAQLADVVGFEGLNVFTIVMNGFIAWAFDQGLAKFTKAPRRAWNILAAAVAAIVIVNLLGIGRATPWDKTDSELRVLAVQGNIGNFDKYMSDLHSDFGVPIVAKYLELTRKGLEEHPDAQMIMWPETAFPGYFDRNYLSYGLQSQVRAFIRERHLPFLTGAYSSELGSRNTYNGLFHLNTEGDLGAEPYRKSILLVFGETFPFSEYIPYMAKLFPDQGSFSRGPGPTIIPIKLNATATEAEQVRFGAQICYEGLYPWFTAELAASGAQVIGNVTNDSWFWSPFEPNQHLYMTLARAIEVRRPLFRATNTGITTAILASGEILEKSPQNAEWTGLFKIRYQKNPAHTVYEKIVPFWPWFLLFALLTIIAAGLRAQSRGDRGTGKA